jgi:hypothetical protein
VNKPRTSMPWPHDNRHGTWQRLWIPSPSALARQPASALQAARQKPTQADEYDDTGNQRLQSVSPQRANTNDDDRRR